jgi:hypothetical protein
MAFQRKQQGGNTDAAFTVKLSAKQGNKWVEGGSFSFWPNENGGPAFKGSLKEERLQSIIEFLTCALEEGLTVSMSMFDNTQQGRSSGGGFKKQGGFTNAFKKSGASFGAKKASPFKRQHEEQQEEQQGEDNNGPFGND